MVFTAGCDLGDAEEMAECIPRQAAVMLARCSMLCQSALPTHAGAGTKFSRNGCAFGTIDEANRFSTEAHTTSFVTHEVETTTLDVELLPRVTF
jgi:hypothetical protein